MRLHVSKCPGHHSCLSRQCCLSPGSQGQRRAGRRDPEASWGVFLGRRQPGGRLLVRFAEAGQCLHFIPLLLLCLVCRVNSQEDKGSSPGWLSTPAVLLGGFRNPVPLGK